MKGYIVTPSLRVQAVNLRPALDAPDYWLTGRRKVLKADVYAKASDAITAAETQLAAIYDNLVKRLVDLDCRAGRLKQARMHLRQGE